MKKIKKVLIANRGEIAIRIAKTLRILGIKPYGVYSEADKDSLHRRFMVKDFYIGEAEPLKSYLNKEKILEIAKEEKVDAIHPGYGFLAENHEFAKMCEDEGITFLGPSSYSIKLMGDKIEARKIMSYAGVPIIPGAEIENEEKAIEYAKGIGFPVILKASKGGGGKGMRIVEKEEDFLEAFQSAKREAKSSFGDDTIYIEKYIGDARHIEVQILGDKFGNYYHLWERECSVQRKHQKIIEETPSVVPEEDIKNKMYESAKMAAQAAGYVGIGTVEFIYSPSLNQYYFLEMNTRIQVEHPITEETTGLDLVKLQIDIEEEKDVSYINALQRKGYSIEVRIYAEDPENNFVPSGGKILFYKEPTGPGIRCDSGVDCGSFISPYYDPMIAKLIVYTQDRNIGIKKMIETLKNFPILGVKTNIPFLIDVLKSQEFVKGDYNTKFIEEKFSSWKEEKDKTIQEILPLIKEDLKNFTSSYKTSIAKDYDIFKTWKELKGFRIFS